MKIGNFRSWARRFKCTEKEIAEYVRRARREKQAGADVLSKTPSAYARYIMRTGPESEEVTYRPLRVFVARWIHIHGSRMRPHTLKGVWKSMKDRCLNPKNTHYRFYGAKGIKVCDEWLHAEPDSDMTAYDAFEEFAYSNAWENGLEMHRLDHKKDYAPGNIVFLWPSEHRLANRWQRAGKRGLPIKVERAANARQKARDALTFAFRSFQARTEPA